MTFRVSRPRETRPFCLDWFIYPSKSSADHAAALLARMTGDRCATVEQPPFWRVLRYEPSGAEVNRKC